MRRLLTVLVLAALVAACSERPTAVNDEGTPGPQFMQTLAADDTMPPGNGWTLLYYEDVSDPATSPWYVDDHPCLGPGRSVEFLKYWWWSKDFVYSPSGTIHATQRLTWNSGGYLAPNGDIWQLQKMVQPLIARWDRVGSEWVAQNTGEAWYVNTRTGQRMKGTGKYVLRFPEMPTPGSGPNYTGFEVRQSHCQLMGPE